MTVEVKGREYMRESNGHWIRLAQDGSAVGYSSTREAELLDEIERLRGKLDPAGEKIL